VRNRVLRALILNSMTLHETCQTIPVTVNGEERIVPNGINVLAMLTFLEIDPARVAVELNRSIVRQAQWESTLIAEGAKLEIVQFVGGG
jgi:sulfur carrier protein